jgi:hypothetical protein
MLKSQSKTNIIKRVIISVVFLLLTFILPWWLVLVMGLVLAFYFENFYELILAGLILDGLYGGIVSIEKFYFVFTFTATVITLLLINFKKRLLIR